MEECFLSGGLLKNVMHANYGQVGITALEFFLKNWSFKVFDYEEED